MKLNFLEKLKNCRRILSIAKKPDKDELIFVLKVTSIGMLVIGMIGFIFYLISILLLG